MNMPNLRATTATHGYIPLYNRKIAALTQLLRVFADEIDGDSVGEFFTVAGKDYLVLDHEYKNLSECLLDEVSIMGGLFYVYEV